MPPSIDRASERGSEGKRERRECVRSGAHESLQLTTTPKPPNSKTNTMAQGRPRGTDDSTHGLRPRHLRPGPVPSRRGSLRAFARLPLLSFSSQSSHHHLRHHHHHHLLLLLSVSSSTNSSRRTRQPRRPNRPRLPHHHHAPPPTPRPPRVHPRSSLVPLAFRRLASWFARTDLGRKFRFGWDDRAARDGQGFGGEVEGRDPAEGDLGVCFLCSRERSGGSKGLARGRDRRLGYARKGRRSAEVEATTTAAAARGGRGGDAIWPEVVSGSSGIPLRSLSGSQSTIKRTCPYCDRAPFSSFSRKLQFHEKRKVPRD